MNSLLTLLIKVKLIYHFNITKVISLFYFLLLSSFLQAQATDTLNVFTNDTITICQTDLITISAENHGITNPTFSWSSGQTDSMITVGQAGVYIVTVTNNVDTIIDSITVFVDSLIDLSVNDTIICEFPNFVQLTSYHPLGSWSGVGIQNDTFDIGLAGGVNVYSVYYNVTNGVCIDSNVVNLDVKALPPINLSNDTTIYCNTAKNIIIDSTLFLPYLGIWNGNGIVNHQAIFNPQLAGGLSYNGSDTIHLAVLQVQDNFGCVNQDTLRFKIIYGDTLIVPNEMGICRYNGLDTLSKYAQISNTTGIVWSGNGIVNPTLGIFDPQLSNVDTINPNIIIVTQGQGSCAKSDTLKIRVGIPPIINAGNNYSICLNEGIDTLAGFSPINYTNAHWQGLGIIDSVFGIFNPQIAGVGLHTLTYHWLNPITNCAAFDDIIVNVLQHPTASIFPITDTICNQNNILLSNYFTISPNGFGSLWFGNGISAPSQGVFSPNNFGVGGFGAGDYTLSYVFVDNNFCSDTLDVTINITNGAVVNAGSDMTICLNDGQQTLQGFPQGGLWNSKLQGLISSSQAIYEPLFVGGGVTDTLIYAYNDGVCINRDTVLLTINQNPVVYVNFNDTVCLNNGNYLLSGNYPISGGFWTGSNGILNPVTGLYNPNQALQSNDSLYFNYIDINGCANSALKVIHIDTIPFVEMANIDPFYYRDQVSVTLIGTPSNGLFYSNQSGVTFNNNNYIFNPQVTNSNNVNIYFTYTNGRGCTNADTQSIIIRNRFLNISTSITALANSAMDWGDYDNDGDLDLIIIGSNSSGRKTMIYQNNNGNFSTNAILNSNFVQMDNGDVKWGDYDNDGDLDVAITGNVANSVFPTTKIYENRINTTGNFVEDIQANSLLIGVQNSSIDWADLDNDGDLDLIVLGKTSSNLGLTRIYKNKKNENGGFSVFANLEPLYAGAISIGDYDNDTDLDIAITGYSTLSNTAKTILYKNDNNQFNSIFTALTDLQESDLEWGDYDNDGDLDILISGFFVQSGARLTRLFENSSGNFINVTTGFDALDGIEKGKVAWGDYDNDGDLDILMIGKRSSSDAGYSKVYRNNLGDSQLPLFNILPVSLNPVFGGDATWADYDNDGDLDIFFIGSQINTSNNYFQLYKNYNELNNLNNQVPTAPNNLQDSVILATGDVILSWSHSFDNSTPYNSLSYNVLIGSTLSAINDLSPMSNITNGKRHIIRHGNTGLSNINTLKNLPEGKHYWKVQAIDNNFDGGNFSVTDSFDVRRILIDSIPEVICAGATVDLHYTTRATNYFNFNNIFTVEISETSDNFANPISIGTINSDTSGVVSVTIPETIAGGIYKVRMIANSPNSISLPYVNDITIHPTSGLSVFTNNTLFCSGNSIILTTSNNPIYNYQWKMNDSILIGSIDTFLQVIDTAIFTVITTTNNGCIDSSSISTDFYSDPVPNFSIVNNCLYEGVTPVNLSTIFQDGIATHQWTFGDGNSGFGFAPTHQYNQVDTFNIKLITTSLHGCQDSITKPIVIHPLPKASFEVDDVCFRENVIFTNTSMLPTYGTIDTFSWDFGDNTFSLFENPIHLYNLSDTFYVNLKATSDNGCITDTTRKLVIHPLPLPNFYTPNHCQYEEVTFNNLSQSILIPIDSFIWTFDDGYFSTDSLPSHIYTVADTFNVRLNAITPFGCETDTIIPVIIHPVPETGFYAVGDCSADYSIQFFDTSSIKSGDIDNYQWYFGDGSQSNDINPLHQYNAETVYDVRLVTTSNYGCMDSITQSTPSSLLPIADFEFFKNPISLGDTLRPQNYSINAVNYFWDFGDFNITTGVDTSIIQTPKYFYTDYGFYKVSLTVFNELGCLDTISHIVKVQSRPRSDYEPLIYPNPTTGICNLNIDLKEEVELDVLVYNSLGQIVWRLGSTTAIPSPDLFDLYKVEIDLENQNSGVYFVLILIDGIPYSTTGTIQNGALKGRDLDYNSLKILVIKP
jgi:PKD repeat protein